MTAGADEWEAPATAGADLPDLALWLAYDLVTRYRLRLVDQRDTRLGPLAGRYLLGAAAWTGRRAAFVGVYHPPADPQAAAGDVEQRWSTAVAWAQERLQVQGAERAEVLLLALSPLGTAPPLPPAPKRIAVGVLAVDVARGTVTVVAPSPPGLPGRSEIRRHLRHLDSGRRPPTLAAVDLAERQTVAGGYTAPTRQALSTTSPVTVGLIALFLACWLAETAALHRLRAADPLDPTPVFQAKALLALGGLPDSGPLAGDWWRYVGSAFLHDPHIFHLASNGVAMFVIGRLVEQLYGRLTLLATFLVGAVGAGLFWVGCTAVGLSQADPLSPGIGASGGIAGLAGLLLTVGHVQGRDVPRGLAAAVRQYIVVIAVLNLVIGLSIPGVNNFAHIGGFLSGVVCGLLLPPRAAIGGRDLRPAERLVLSVVVLSGVVAFFVAAQHAYDVTAQLRLDLGVAPSLSG